MNMDFNIGDLVSYYTDSCTIGIIVYIFKIKLSVEHNVYCKIKWLKDNRENHRGLILRNNLSTNSLILI